MQCNAFRFSFNFVADKFLFLAIAFFIRALIYSFLIPSVSRFPLLCIDSDYRFVKTIMRNLERESVGIGSKEK